MKSGFEASKCIDGITDGPDATDLCQTKPEMAPWLALSFGEAKLVSLEKVKIFNILKYDGSKSTKEIVIEIRVADELPKSAEEMFKGGVLLTRGTGALPEGRSFSLDKFKNWEKQMGRYLILQMDIRKSSPSSPLPLNFKEVLAYGKTNAIGISQFIHIALGPEPAKTGTKGVSRGDFPGAKPGRTECQGGTSLVQNRDERSAKGALPGEKLGRWKCQGGPPWCKTGTNGVPRGDISGAKPG